MVDITGTPGDDRLVSPGFGGNRLYGLGGNDVLVGNRGGADQLYGGTGDDSYSVGSAANAVFEAVGEGYDRVYIGSDVFNPFYKLAAGQEIEWLGCEDSLSTAGYTLYGNEFGQVLAGNAAGQEFYGGGGADTYVGRKGDDIFYVTDARTWIIEVANEGTDRAYTTVSYALAAGSSVEVLAVQSGVTAAIDLQGNELNQTVAGNNAANILNGGGGVDTLIGYGGDDTYIVGDSRVTIFESANQGYDVVYSTVNYTLGQNESIEALLAYDASSTAAINLAGNNLTQVIAGNAGANLIADGGGADTLIGRGGDDSYFITDSAARVWEAANEGLDTVYANTSYALEAGQSIERLFTYDASATTAINLTGNDLAQVVAGNAGANVIDGGAGADTLVGRGGADTFAFTTALGGGNVDWIADYEVGVDRILLDDAVFAGMATGALAPGRFVAGTVAGDADDRIVYDSASGSLWFDVDGTGSAAAVLFATVTPGLALTAGDFLVV